MPKTMKPSEMLRAARKKIEPDGAWTQGAFSYNSDGEEVNPQSTEAVCWCSLGAIAAVIRGSSGLDARIYLSQSYDDLVDIPQWNDALHRTHTEVLDAFLKAVILAEAEGH